MSKPSLGQPGFAAAVLDWVSEVQSDLLSRIGDIRSQVLNEARMDCEAQLAELRSELAIALDRISQLERRSR